MQDDERISGALQENLLAMLCFDKAHAKMIRAALTPQHFESAVYREVAGVAIDFIDQYSEPVGEHLPDHLEHILKGEDTRKAASYDRLLKSLFAGQASINPDYVISSLHKFVRQQNMKSAVLRAVEALGDGRIDDAEVELQKGLKNQVLAFEPGIDLADAAQSLTYLDNADEAMLTGIDALDRFGIGPSRGTLYLVSGPLGKGKSWWLMQIGKYALLQRHVVLHITLEMSAEKTAQRYHQMLFGITKRPGTVRVPRLTKTSSGDIKAVDYEDIEDLPSMMDDDIRAVLTKKIQRRLSRRAAFKVKKFSSGSLTIAGLNAYLDGLERYEGIVPDIILVDYAELMFMDPKVDKRGAIGTLFVQLRGIADERKCAMVTASQVNRPGIGKTTTDEQDLSEDISKGFTVDTLVTYNQTDMEKKMGLARLHVAKHRDDVGGMTALITQAYEMGQFCLDSVLMGDAYLKSLRGRMGDDDEPEEQPRGRR